MKAVLFEKFQTPPKVVNVEDPTPDAQGVVLKVEATGVCRSDWHGWMGHDSDIELPHIPGHELAGIVEAVGKDVKNWKVGDRVTVPFICGCGSCSECHAGQQQVCLHQEQPGFTHWGSFAEYVPIHQADLNVVALPETLDFATAASLGCRFATSFRAVIDQGKVSAGQWVAVHGCGGVGLSAIMIAQAAGANVIGVDLDPAKLALAKELGAVAAIDGKTDVVEAIKEITKGGAHVSLDALGHPVTMTNSILCLRPRGKHIQVGLMLGDHSAPAVPMPKIVGQEIELLGSHGMQAHRYGAMLDMVESGKLNPARLVGDKISLEQAPDALMNMDKFQSVAQQSSQAFSAKRPDRFMFENLNDYPVDPIMIGADYFAQDPRDDKLNLTVGVYQDEHGNTPILQAVKEAERILVETQVSKSYLALTGDAEYCNLLGLDILGSTFGDDWVAAQTSGGAVALRVMADLVTQLPVSPTVWLQTPTYGNYIPILTAAGAKYQSIPYYDRIKSQITFEQMLEHLRHAKAGDLFLMQGYCHNPTGADMSADQFDALLDILDERGVIPWIDLAYLGFAKGWEADSDVARKIADRFDECIVCITLSKSFGIYRDRAGALFVKTRPADKTKMQRAVSAIVRSGASHAPDHGPSVVRTIMSDPKLKNMWLHDLETMRLRVQGIRQDIVQTERWNHDSDILGYIGTQSGMFSLLPITAEQEHALTRDHGIHVVQGGRVNVARLKPDDISTLINATHDVLGL